LDAWKEKLKYKLAKVFQVDIKDMELGICMQQLEEYQKGLEQWKNNGRIAKRNKEWDKEE
jgi:hypothetical protein